MKIFILINSLEGGGAERVVQSLSNYWTSEGKKVSIYYIDDKKIAYELSPTINVKCLSGISINSSVLKILSFLPLAYKWRSILKLERPDITISFLPRANIINVLAGHPYNRKITISERTPTLKAYSTNSIKDLIMKRLISYCYKKTDLIIAISNEVQNSLIDLGLRSKHIQVVDNPQPIDEICEMASKDKWKRPSADLVLVSSGRLISLKNHKLQLLIVHKLFYEYHIDVKLIIIGGGPEKEKLNELCNKLGLQNNIKWMNWQKNPFKIIRNSDIFIHTSLWEGFGNVLVEAMICDTPIICLNSGLAVQYILENGKSGILVQKNDESAFVGAILDLLKSETLLAKIIKRGQLRSKDFSIEHIANKYIDLTK